jgi:hypothetical protein
MLSAFWLLLSLRELSLSRGTENWRMIWHLHSRRQQRRPWVRVCMRDQSDQSAKTTIWLAANSMQEPRTRLGLGKTRTWSFLRRMWLGFNIIDACMQRACRLPGSAGNKLLVCDESVTIASNLRWYVTPPTVTRVLNISIYHHSSLNWC